MPDPARCLNIALRHDVGCAPSESATLLFRCLHFAYLGIREGFGEGGVEQAAAGVVARLAAKSSQSGANGLYITAEDLIDEFDLVPPRMPSTSGLATRMKRLGWDSGRAGKDRARVYYAPAAATSRDGAMADCVMSSKSNRTK